jgi:hypothetical protein
LWSVLEASRETLKSIRLVTEEFDREEKIYFRFWKMRFPQLQSFSFGNWYSQFEGDREEFTKFIVAHGDTLEELDLKYSKYRDYAITFGSSAFLKKDSLPRLKEFKGHTDAFKQMVEKRMNCLQTSLEILDIGPGGIKIADRATYRLQRAFDSILQPNQPKLIFNALRELRIDLSSFEYWGEPDKAFEYIHKASEFCGSSLEVWLGDIPKSANMNGIIEAFSKFEKLRVIRIRRDIGHGFNLEKVVRKLAEKCLKLEEIGVIDSDIIPRVSTLITIVRDVEMALPAMPYADMANQTTLMRLVYPSLFSLSAFHFISSFFPIHSTWHHTFVPYHYSAQEMGYKLAKHRDSIPLCSI